ncbi:hypothetical protein RirG_144060 [Rhizophagus irregularis DAOM 197198w]|uniref:Crinkler effector protein N-terminal domain-containing protein n=1 Tax=Rhizophagus irregularis (strain DAOM 197198w) TaxID=1432141 RepID=A0A015J480_RHIIW|nr:hypothetical protein RirG_144060 [Rhizophagus irregularis DAOM 197198w]
MSITLLCLVKGNTTASAFPVDINKDQLVGYLKKVIKAEKQNDFAGIDTDKLKLWNVLEEALLCIPPPITYSPDCTKSKTTTKVNGGPLTSVQLWDDFFDKVNQFRFDQQPILERPKFVVKEIENEEDVRSVLDFNICQTLNYLLGSDHKFSRCSPDTPGIPDFTCHLVGSLILVIEAKRKHVLEDMGEEIFPEFYQTSKGKDVQSTLYKCTTHKCTPSLNAHICLVPSLGLSAKYIPFIYTPCNDFKSPTYISNNLPKCIHVTFR